MKEPTNKTRHSRKNLLPLLLAVTGLLARGSVSHAATYATYDFSTYTPGNLVGQSSPAWAAVTAANYTGTSPIQVVSGVAQVRFGGATTTLWQSAGVGVSDIPINAAGKVTYFAYEMKVINAYRSSSGNGDYVTGLSTAATFAGGTHNRIFLKKTADSTKFSFGMNCATGIQYNDDLLYSLNSAYTIVIKHEAINGTGTEGKNDKVSLYVKSATEGAESLVLIMTQSYDGTGTYRKADGTYAALAALTAVSEPTIFKSHGIFQRPAGSAGASNSVDISKITFGESLAEVGVNTTPTPSVPVVADATNAGTGGFTANWTAASSATGYDLDVFTDSELTVHLSGYPKSVGAVTTYSVTGPFASGATLYYKVRASNSAGYSTYSGVQTVSITDAPAVLVPTVTNSATSGTVTWTSGPDWIPNNPISTNTATVTFNGLLTGNLVATNDSTGNFVLNAVTNAISGTGSLTYTGGTFQFVANGSTNPTLTFANNALVQTFSNNIQVDAELKVNAGSTALNPILAGPISGVGGVYKTGSGTVLITRNDNTFDGATTVSAGQLTVQNLGNSNSASSLGRNAAISLGSATSTGTLRWESVASETSDKSIVLGGSTGGGTLDVRGTANILTLDGPISTGTNAGTRNFTLTGQGGATVNGLISGNAGLRVNGSSTRTVTLANANNSFGGPVTIDGNIAGASYKLQVANIGNAGSNSPLGTNGTINIGTTTNAFNFLVCSNTLSETTDKTINLAGTVGPALIVNKGPVLLKFTAPVTATGAGAKTFYADQDDTNGVTEFAGNIPDSSSGATTIKKGGAGKLVLSAANTFTGGMRFNGGTLELGNPSALAAGNYLKYESQASGTALVKVAYTAAGPNLGNLEVDVNGTLDLGTNSSAEIRFATATGWMAGATLTITNSTGGGKLYILDSEGLDSAQIVSAENPTYVASVDDNGLVTFTAPTPVGSTFTSWLGSTDATSDLLLQYAFGAVSATQPVAPAYFPQASVTETGGVRSLVLTYYVRQGTQGLEVEPELSTDLSAANNGFAESFSITKSDHEISEVGGVSLQRKTASVPIESGAAKKFLRARVTQN